MQVLEERPDTVDLFPAVENAVVYYATVRYGGRLAIAKLDNGEWRVMQRSEMLSIMGANGINPSIWL